MEWLDHAPEAALQVILRATSTNGSGSVVILRCKRELDDICRGFPDDSWRKCEPWLKLRALLELLTTSPSAALAIFDARLGQFAPSTEAHESLILVSLSMLYSYGNTLRSPISSGFLRQRAEQAFQLYPNNTIILGIFLEAEKGQSIWGRVNLMLNETGSGAPEKNLVRILSEIWAICWQKGSWKGEEERIRSRLSAAVESNRYVSSDVEISPSNIFKTIVRTRGSSLLWRIYLHFEIRTGRLKQSKLLLFRAIKECPMVKGENHVSLT
jgi:hypothetical protein